MKPTSTNCSFHPNVAFLLITLTATSAATAMLCIAMMTEHWEYINWDKEKLGSIEGNMTTGTSEGNNCKLEWLLDGEVARIVLESKYFQRRDEHADSDDLPALFLAPIHSGIWTYCIHLNAQKLQLLRHKGFPNALCANFLKLRTFVEGNKKMDSQNRMRNLSMSCALVCLIILSSSALTGAFGVAKQQTSAILVTGVMYLLAAIFAIFSLTIINFKRTTNRLDCLNASNSFHYAGDGVILSTTALEKAFSLNNINNYLTARILSTGYSFQLGWGGIATCILVSIFWISLSKLMRYNPINGLITIF